VGPDRSLALMTGSSLRGLRLGLVALPVVAGALSLLLPPPGLVTLALAVACLWPWHWPTGWHLDRVGPDRRVLLVTGSVLLAGAALANLGFGGQLDGHLMYRGDFQTYYVGAEVGLRHGWSHIFDQALQRPLWTQAFAGRAPFIPYLNTPPQAWLVAPLALLPYPAAYATWVAVMVVISGLVAWLLAPPTWGGRAVISLAAVALWVLAYSLGGGQNAMFGPLAIVLCWWLLGAGRPALAGVALALLVVRPNATFLVPVALLLAGQRRLFVGWLGASVAAGAIIVVSLGAEGIRQFLELGAEIRRTHPGAVTMTVAHIFGDGLPGALVGVAFATAALAVAFRAGRDRPGVAIAAGVLASFFVTPYVHIQDVLSLLAAAAIVARSNPRSSFGLVLVALLLTAPPGTIFGGAWAAVLLVVEVAWLGWLAVEVLPARAPSQPRSQSSR
jgi:hypothetical protein